MIQTSDVTEIGVIRSSDNLPLLRMWNVTVPPGERVLRRHSHLCFEITSVRAGSGTYSIGDSLYPMEVGDVFIFSSNEQHCITNVSPEGLLITNLHFEPRLLWGNSPDRLSDQNVNLCFSHNKDFRNRIEAGASLPLLDILRTIEAELQTGSAEYALSVKSYLNLLLIKLIRDYHYTSQDSRLSRQQLHAIRRVHTYIDQHLTETLTLEILGEVAGMTPNYLSSLFHSVSGITLWDYITAKRIEKATHMLTQPYPLNLLDIAIQCGYNNTANFNKAFKKVTGMTPSEYRAIGRDPL